MEKRTRSAKPLTEKEKAAIEAYMSTGKTYREIAEQFGISKDALWYRINRYQGGRIRARYDESRVNRAALVVELERLEESLVSMEETVRRISTILSSIKKAVRTEEKSEGGLEILQKKEGVDEQKA